MGPRPVIDQALIDEVHRAAYVADAHADSLLWNRDLSARNEDGEVDFPRLRDGGVKLQCLTLVTRGFPVVGGFRAMAWWHGWPASARRDERSRAEWQIEQLERFCAASPSQAAIAQSARDLSSNERDGRISAVLGIEGAHALMGEAAAVERFHRRGVRFLSLTHLMHNDTGGSSFPLARHRGLTGLGREVVAEMARLRMAVDLAHASPALVEDVLATRAPVFCSHTGVGSVTRSWRNLPDELVRAIAHRGGVVCVIFATEFLGGRTLRHLARHVERAVAVAGEGGVGLGSDFDGTIHLPRTLRDARDYPRVTGALLEQGLSRGVVGKVLGANLRRFLEAFVL
jgi:membrane dipeptidase